MYLNCNYKDIQCCIQYTVQVQDDFSIFLVYFFVSFFLSFLSSYFQYIFTTGAAPARIKKKQRQHVHYIYHCFVSTEEKKSVETLKLCSYTCC